MWIQHDLSQAVLNSIYNKSHYMEVDIRNVYRHDNAMLTVTPLLIHMYRTMSTIRSVIKAESSTSFKAYTSVQVTAKLSLAASKFAGGRGT
jgi:hypothetical protein